MKYKGFIIEKRYYIGADWKLDSHGRAVPRRPKPEDIECYDVLDPMENGDRFCSEDTVQECKHAIDEVLHRMNMKDNLPKTWAKLEGNPYATASPNPKCKTTLH